MTVIRHVAQWNSIAARLQGGEPLGLVPTMGALHGGHGALLDAARQRCAVVVASIFVNPIQFERQSDYDLYPRMLDADVAFCAARGADYVFAPAPDEIYPEPQSVFVDVKGLTEHLCGQDRPGHFRGVATVFLKLFEIVRPHMAFFGEKHYQQLTVIRRLVRDLNLPVQIAGVPTVRARDGLAMSSRNCRLSARERTFACYLYKALSAARQAIAAGEADAEFIKARALEVLQAVPEIGIEYLDLVDPDTIQPVSLVCAPVRAVIASWIGRTRLIDNVLCEPPAIQTKARGARSIFVSKTIPASAISEPADC